MIVNRNLIKFLDNCCEDAFILVELILLKDAYMKSFLCKKNLGLLVATRDPNYLRDLMLCPSIRTFLKIATDVGSILVGGKS